MARCNCERCGKPLDPEYISDDGRCSSCGENLCESCAEWADTMDDLICKRCYESTGEGEDAAFV